MISSVLPFTRPQPVSGMPVLLEECADHFPLDRMICTDMRWIARRWLDMPIVPHEALPRWASFYVPEFTHVLSKLCVLHIASGDADSMEFTVYGGHPTKFVGLGKPLCLSRMREDPTAFRNYLDIRGRAMRAVEHEKPQYARKTLSWNGRGDIEYEAMMLPFAPDASGVQRVLQPVSAWMRDGSELRLPQSGVL